MRLRRWTSFPAVDFRRLRPAANVSADRLSQSPAPRSTNGYFERHTIVRSIWTALLIPGLACGQIVFEVASIKPSAPIEFGRTSVRRSVSKTQGAKGRLLYQGLSLLDLISDARRVQKRQISGPDWLGSERFDIQAVIPADQTNDQIPEMLEALLHERFKLKTHDETKDMQVYRLIVAKGGAKLEKADQASGISGRSTKTTEQVTARITLASFAEYLSQKLDRPVVDQTGLAGVYKIQLEWGPDTVDAAGPSIFTAMPEQLGLRLAAAKTGVRVVVVDGIEKTPADN
jgi:uncharacterized protein (TIGR03435 family)